MKVMLIVPTQSYSFGYPIFLSNTDFPAGFAYLAAALKSAGHEVYGVNPNNNINFNSAQEMVQSLIEKACCDYQPELIGLGGLCTDFEFLKDATEIIRKIDSSLPIVMGGGIITHDADFIFQTLMPDYCIVGEGEEAIVALADMLDSGTIDFEKIPNIGYWLNGKPQFSRRCHDYIDINKLNSPDYSPFQIEDMLDNFAYAARYLYRYTRSKPRPMTLVAARNCPFKCTFCVHNKGSRYRSRSIENIVEEIRISYQKYKFNILIILDELFATGKKRLKEFCAAVVEGQEKYGWDFDWAFQTHANANLDRETLEMIKAAGCYFFSYGMESASGKVLESMNKKTQPSQLSNAIELAEQVKIGFGGNFIFGDPVETPETISETLSFYKKYCTEIHVFLAELKPYPGSKLFIDCLENGTIPNKLAYYSHIDKTEINMTTIPNKDWTHWLRRIIPALATFPLVPCVNASGIIRGKSLLRSPISENGKKVLWYLKVHCPYCEKILSYPEVVDEESVQANGYRVLTGCPHCHKRINVNIPTSKAAGIIINIEVPEAD